MSRRSDKAAWPVACGGLLLGALLLAVSCRAEEARSREFRGGAMGTQWMVKVVGEGLSAQRGDELQSRVASELERVEALMSHYREDSELSRFNRDSGEVPFEISRETGAVFAEALAIGELSGGALDVTVGPLVDAWGFGPADRLPEPPAAEVIEALRAATGTEHLQLDVGAGTLLKARPELSCDLSAIAKGYAVDKVAEALEEEGIENYLVEVGGELRVRGCNDLGDPWRVAIERPVPGQRAVQRILALSRGGLATSGDYRNYYEVEGRRVAHILDPRTGRPIAHRLASVSVVDASCMRADGLATALMVLGPREGLALAEELGLSALFLVRDERGEFEEVMTPPLRALVLEVPPKPGR